MQHCCYLGRGAFGSRKTALDLRNHPCILDVLLLSSLLYHYAFLLISTLSSPSSCHSLQSHKIPKLAPGLTRIAKIMPTIIKPTPLPIPLRRESNEIHKIELPKMNSWSNCRIRLIRKTHVSSANWWGKKTSDMGYGQYSSVYAQRETARPMNGTRIIVVFFR